MFILSIKNIDEISRINNNEVYNAFTLHLYKIYYELSQDESTIFYSAHLKDEYINNVRYLSYPKYLYFSVDLSGELSFNQSNLESVNAFIYYIYSLESSLGDKNLDLYPEIKDKLSNSIVLSPKERLRRAELRDTLLKIVETSKEDDNKDSIVRSDTPSSFAFNIRFESAKEDTFYIFLNFVTSKKTYIVTNISELINDYKSNKPYVKGKNEFELTSDNFKGPYFEFLSYLSTIFNETFYYKYYINRNTFIINKSQLINIIKIIKGERFIIDNDIIFVNPIEAKAGLELDEENGIKLVPDLKKDNFEYVSQGKTLVTLNDKEAQIYNFDSELIESLYVFFLENDPKDTYPYIKDIFKSKVLPKISSKIIKTKTIKDESSSFKINLYIDTEKFENLIFKTEYLNDELDSENELRSAYIDALKSNYLRILNSLGGLENGTIINEDSITTFLSSDMTELKKVSTVYLSDSLKSLTILKKVNININASYKNDWLSLSFTSDKYSPDEIARILNAYRKKKKYIVLKDDFILLDDENLKDLDEIARDNFSKNEVENDRVPFFESLKLKAYDNEKNHINLDDHIKNAITSIINYKNYPLDEMDPNFKEYLRDYQYDAVKWMRILSNYHLSGILADDMGLGKTIETIAYISTIKDKRPVLVLSPKSLIYNWKNEFKKWNSKREVVVIEGNKDDREAIINKINDSSNMAYISSYDTIKNDLDLYENIKFSLIVIDEAQYIKNSNALRYKAIKRLKSEYRFALTGTPIENSLSDLWSIFDFLNPGYFKKLNVFLSEYEDDKDKDILVKKVLPFILRRTKEEMLSSLPLKEIVNLTVNMNDEQKLIYDAYLEKAKVEISTSSSSSFQILSHLTRLRQICVDPSSFLDGYKETSSKLSLSVDLIRDSINNGHKVLLFSQFTKVLEHLRNLLDLENIKTYYISGDTPAKLRINLCDKFNEEDNTRVMLVSLKAGGTGLNLHGADIVIHLDPWWNVSAENQATDRAHRIGQTRNVTVYKLISYNTIEEKVVNLQNMKKDLFDKVIKSGDEGLEKLSIDDIKYIVS
ncbi:MAG: SNF2 helicase associated domain-containing protein [Gammaproteobacteria bacterium]|nr:SNF2 helicase associated domain-containing protein [Gammaproteobacteria bacterium]